MIKMIPSGTIGNSSSQIQEKSRESTRGRFMRGNTRQADGGNDSITHPSTRRASCDRFRHLDYHCFLDNLNGVLHVTVSPA